MSVQQRFGIFWKRTASFLIPNGDYAETGLNLSKRSSMEVCLGGIVHNPDSNWTTQIARNMCDMWDGFMLGKNT